ncbi:hypothetical protein SLA2020_115750 [Shorea laevis]
MVEPSFCSSSWFRFDLIPSIDSKKLLRIILASAKGFSIRACLKSGLALFSILVRLRQRRSSSTTRKVEVSSNNEAILPDLLQKMYRVMANRADSKMGDLQRGFSRLLEKSL